MSNRGALSTWLPLLLADPSFCLRWLVLRDLLERPAGDPEVLELARLRENDRLVANLLDFQEPDGSWKRLGHRAYQSTIQITAQALIRLGYLGFHSDFPAVQRAAEFLFSAQRSDGAWPLPGEIDEGEGYGNYSMVPLQTAIPLRGLAACGYAIDPRAEKAYDWLSEQRLPDGAWPSGIASDNYASVAGYRRLAHSRWGCRSNTTGALLCLALHPTRRNGSEAERALDLLLGRETKERHSLGYEVTRIIGLEPARGFFTYYAHFDLALILYLCRQVGASLDDDRVVDIVNHLRKYQGPYGLWENKQQPQASRWVTFDLLNSLGRIDKNSHWISSEPRTVFRIYSKRQRRF